MLRIYLRFLVAELFLIPVVALIFRFIEPRLRAGMVAGTLFVLLGVWIVFSLARSAEGRKSLTVLVGGVHLFVIAMPMLAVRIMNASQAFENVLIWGLPGPVFHRLSTVIYLFLIAATVTDGVREYLRQPEK